MFGSLKITDGGRMQETVKTWVYFGTWLHNLHNFWFGFFWLSDDSIIIFCFVKLYQQKFHTAPPPISNFACNSTYFSNCCSRAAIFRFPMNHKPHMCNMTLHKKHPLCVTHTIIEESCNFIAFFSGYFTFILKWITLHVKMFDTTEQANKKKRFQRPQTKRNKIHLTTFIVGDHGSAVVKVLYYKSEGHWFDSRWCHWNFSFT